MATPLSRLLREAVAYLRSRGCNTSEGEVRRLWRHAAATVATAHGRAGADVVEAEFRRLLELRATGLPADLIIGQIRFAGVELAVERGVLVPRPETEELAYLAIEEARRRAAAGAPVRVLDVGTGTGALALAIARAVPKAAVTAIDVDERACALARRNQELNNIATVEIECVSFEEFAARGSRRFDVVVSNPPYVAESERGALPVEVAAHEPETALFGGPDGLDVIRAIVRELPSLLAVEPARGTFLLEVGSAQAEAVVGLCVEAGLVARPLRDLSGRWRFVVGGLA